MAKKLTVRQRIAKLTDIALNGLSSKTGFSDWIIIGGGKIKKSTRPDEFDLVINCAPLISQKKIMDFENSKEITVPTGSLGILRPRTVITNGVVNGFHEEKTKTKTVILTNPKNAEIVKGSEFISQEPSEMYEVLKNTKYVKLKVVDEGLAKNAYVQCIEVLRFYYGSSNGLINSCFSGDEAKYSVYNNTVGKSVGDSAYVQLRKNLYDVDAPAAARIRFCEYAKKQFNNLRNLTFYADDSSEKWIAALPPIKDLNTKWGVRCKNISGGLVITNIINCKGKLPFKKLIFGRDNDSRLCDIDNRIHKKVEKPMPRPPANPDDSDDTSQNDKKPQNLGGTSSSPSPDVNLDTEKLDFTEHGGQFGSLDNIQIDKIIKVDYKTEEKRSIEYIDSDLREATAYATSKARNKNTGAVKLHITANRKQDNGKKPESDLNEIEFISTAQILAFLCRKLGFKSKYFQLDGFERVHMNTSYTCFPHEKPLDRHEKKSNEFTNLLINVITLKVNEATSKNYQFAFVEFYDQYYVQENRSALLINLTGLEKHEWDTVLKTEIVGFRNNGRSWAKNEFKNGVLPSDKKRLVHAKKGKNNLGIQIKKYTQRISELEPELLKIEIIKEIATS
jgi:hypothetical protein